MIVLLDGAMGTMIQGRGLTEADFRGSRFADWPSDLSGNNDLLCLTRPDVIEDISSQYAAAGADILTTNTFNANAISMADYGMAPLVREINLAGAAIARRAAARSGRPGVKVAGSVGPTNKTASMSADIADPGSRAVTYDELRDAYMEQIDALAEGGVDMLLFETVFDTLNLKAGLDAAAEVAARRGHTLSVMVSVTIAGRDGRTFSGQTLEALVASVDHAPIASLGINCSFGPREIRPWLRQLSAICPWPISCHPNAGLPDADGIYSESPASMAEIMGEIIDEGLVNIIGGCCGTTPDHIAAMREVAAGKEGRNLPAPEPALRLSGLDMTEIRTGGKFVVVGERCNVAGSRKFLRLIREGALDEALEIARQQVGDGAGILDINMDDGLLDAEAEMKRFLNLLASEPDIARVPLMIDSSDWRVIESALKCVQGKSIVNSISLKEGEEEFLRRARIIRRLGAAVVVMAFDEKGQADTFERKIEVCGRAYRLLTEEAGFPPEEIIFDPNVLAIATGMEEHDRYGLDFIRATEWIRHNLPGAKVSGGLSNLSFSFRGNTPLREAMHAVFLHHAIAAGMDMAIVNPASKVTYEDIDPELRSLLEDVVLARSAEAPSRLADYARESLAASGSRGTSAARGEKEQWRSLPVAGRLMWALEHGISSHLEEDISEILADGTDPVGVIEGPLMEGMNRVGRLFGEGKMFLPQVVRTARTMKTAVALLQPEIDRRADGQSGHHAGKILFATVKGDVHDIGKNIVSIVLACNGYEVIDLGVMVPASTIVETALRERPDIVCLSGLITPSLSEMTRVVREMARAGLETPVMVGGATTSRLHTALKIDPFYPGAVIHVPDASQNPLFAARLLNPATRETFIASLKEEARTLREREAIRTASTPHIPLEEARRHSARSSLTGRGVFTAREREVITIPVSRLLPHINWRAFLAAWKLPASLSTAAGVHDCRGCEEAWIEAQSSTYGRDKAVEALNLIRDARSILTDEWNVRAITRFLMARAENETIVTDAGVTLPTLRRQSPGEDGKCPSLADFVDTEGEVIGAFAASVEEVSHSASGDPYHSLLRQTVAHRLAEAASEWLHLTVACGKGIRPAVGYPILPDQTLNHDLDRLLGMSEIGITVTENGAMHPSASVSGLYISSPSARYFMVGEIAPDQLELYATSRSVTPVRLREILSLASEEAPQS